MKEGEEDRSKRAFRRKRRNRSDRHPSAILEDGGGIEPSLLHCLVSKRNPFFERWEAYKSSMNRFL